MARKTPKERAYIDDSIALRRARTRMQATKIAAKMLDDGQDRDDVLATLWNSANRRGFDDGVRDAMGEG